MTAYIQSVLFEPKNIDKSDVLKSISSLMLTRDLKGKYETVQNVITDTIVVHKKEEEKKEEEKKEEYIEPVQRDTLFWCLYICKHGFGEFKEIKNNYGSKQLEIQQTASMFLKKNNILLKNVNTRITKAMIQEIMSELLIDNKCTSYEVLFGLITYYKINIILMDENEKWCIEFLYEPCSEETDIFIIKKKENKRYIVKEEKLDFKDYEKLKQEKYFFPNYKTSIKAMSNYKMLDLEIIANKLDIDVENKIKKTELYDKIRTHICWD
tara:strand:+ start:3150 stop:3950 length:801 start_codon:yes stop_codon:yes gene_type:complete